MPAPQVFVPRVNRFLINTGAFALVQALLQFIFSLLAIAQHFCVINFLRNQPLLVFIRILYYHEPRRCGTDINIGEVIDELADQAFIYVPKMPRTTLYTFILTCTSLTVSVFWAVGSIILIKGGHRQHHSNHSHWPFVLVLFIVILLDLFGAAKYINDTFYTATLNDLVDHVKGTPSGLGNFNTSTVWAPWVMVLVSSRFGIILIINIGLLVMTILDCTTFRSSVSSSEIERNNFTSTDSSKPSGEGSDRAPSSSPSTRVPKIPRPGLSTSFRSMKDFLLETTRFNRNRNRVNFPPEETSSDPMQHTRTFENLIAEQQRRLRGVTVDTSGRHSPPASRSLPQLYTNPEPAPGVRCVAGHLTRQTPWTYIGGGPQYHMRDQLPPEEDLPPVPLPDYTAYPYMRKASVHRAASSLSSLTQVKVYSNSKSSHQAEPASSKQSSNLREALHPQESQMRHCAPESIRSSSDDNLHEYDDFYVYSRHDTVTRAEYKF